MLLRLRQILITLALVVAALDLFFSNFHYSPFFPCPPFDPRYEITHLPPKEKLNNILSQKFTYLGSGHQCSAYLSEDGQYVLKLAQHLHFRWPSVAKKLPLPRFLNERRQKIMAKQQRQLSVFFLSAKRGFENLKDECGLIYVHLNPSDDLHISLRVRDYFFRPFTIDLDRHVFIVQKKMQPITNALEEYQRNRDTDQIRSLIGHLVQNIANTMRKGLIDTDRSHFKNYGVLGNTVACFDIGNIMEDPKLLNPDYFAAALQKSLQKTRRWIAKDFPDELVFFEQILSEETLNCNQ
ncbi:MAG: hypothetical protein HW387_22 [Parachlamydiales bacterium]|nr:hypothetical protein [Parachlamydiales bacterium]